MKSTVSARVRESIDLVGRFRFPRAFLDRFRSARGRPPAAPKPAWMTTSSVAELLQREVPIFIPSFNNPTYVRSMIDQLNARGLVNITVVDNASTSPEMRAYLDNEVRAIVVRLKSNRGPRDIYLNDANFVLLPDVFCVTDPDLELNPKLPVDFLARLVALTERYQIGKAGFALDVSDPEALRDDYLVKHGNKKYTIWEWEQRFWSKPIGELGSLGTVYRASIDTTFAVYNKKYFRQGTHFQAVRVGGVFTCRHLPWYRDRSLPPAEERTYCDTQRFSFYLEHPNSPSDSSEAS
jgi:hypothetical protein